MALSGARLIRLLPEPEVCLSVIAFSRPACLPFNPFPRSSFSLAHPARRFRILVSGNPSHVLLIS